MEKEREAGRGSELAGEEVPRRGRGGGGWGRFGFWGLGAPSSQWQWLVVESGKLVELVGQWGLQGPGPRALSLDSAPSTSSGTRARAGAGAGADIPALGGCGWTGGVTTGCDNRQLPFGGAYRRSQMPFGCGGVYPGEPFGRGRNITWIYRRAASPPRRTQLAALALSWRT
jgi:hypothetical protein